MTVVFETSWRFTFDKKQSFLGLHRNDCFYTAKAHFLILPIPCINLGRIISVFFMCYLICVALQMGATIDYGILLTSHYRRCRSALPPHEAVAQAMQMSLQTILTSGLALITAGFAVGKISTVFYISSIGTMLARGAVVSVLLILFLLPQLLIWLDRWMIKKNSKKAELSSELSVQ